MRGARETPLKKGERRGMGGGGIGLFTNPLSMRIQGGLVSGEQTTPDEKIAPRTMSAVSTNNSMYDCVFVCLCCVSVFVSVYVCV